jgi:hypothetical protein
VIADGFHDAITATLWTLGALAGTALIAVPVLAIAWLTHQHTPETLINLRWRLRGWLYRQRRRT